MSDHPVSNDWSEGPHHPTPDSPADAGAHTFLFEEPVVSEAPLAEADEPEPAATDLVAAGQEAQVVEARDALPPLDTDPFTPETLGEPSTAANAPWKLKSGPDPEPFDTVLDGGETSTVIARAASCRGSSHRCYAEPRQDSIALAVDESGRWLAAAVADGLGAGARSHLGSAIAAPTAVSFLLEAASSSGGFDPVALVEHVAGRMRTEAQRQLPSVEVRDKDIASTLCAALVDTQPDRAEHRLPVVLVRIGDSTAAQLREGKWEFVFPAAHAADGEVLDTATRWLPQDVMTVQSVECSIGPDSPLFLMSDGVGNPLEMNDQVQRYLASSWAAPPHPIAFLGQMEFRRKSFDDDRSVVGLWSKSD